MALGPRFENRKLLASQVESEIDRLIQDENSGFISIDVRIIPGLDVSLWNEFLATKYRQVGWRKAEWIFDQRDGDYLRFEV